MIIVDDGSSTQEGKLISEPFCQLDSRISYYYISHGGISVARNHAISLSRGKYLAFLDSDDRYLPNALELLLHTYNESKPSVKLVYGNFIKYFQDKDSYKSVRATPPSPRPRLFFQFFIPGGNPVVPAAMMVNKKTIIQLGGFNSLFNLIEDRELWSRLVVNHDIAHVSTNIAIYRIHANQATNNHTHKRLVNARQAFATFTIHSLEQLFPAATNNKEQAVSLDNLANNLIKAPNPPVEVALYLYQLAQKRAPSLKREKFIADLEQKIPQFLINNFGSSQQVEIPKDLKLISR